MKCLLISLLLLIGIITGAAGAVIPPDPVNGYGEMLSQKTDFEISDNHGFSEESDAEYLIFIIDGRESGVRCLLWCQVNYDRCASYGAR